VDTLYPLARPLPPWPAVLPLAEAAAVLGLKADTLQKRVSRRQQPSLLRGGRRSVVLLPAQWATWAQSYQLASVRPNGAGAESVRPRTDPGTAGLLARLEALERRVAELEARPSPPVLPDSDARLPEPVRPDADTPWWRRVLAWLGQGGTPPALGAPRAPLPER
jgi:hypothetical protein